MGGSWLNIVLFVTMCSYTLTNGETIMAVEFNPKWLIPLGVVAAGVISAPMLFGINDAGDRTVIQYPTGTLYVRFEPGIYMLWFGRETKYRDVLTYDFDKANANGEATIDEAGIPVRYQDGGIGTIYGKIRFNLPSIEIDMLKLHKAFRSNNGVAQKLLKPVTEESQNLTAGLMTSEAAYAEKRGTFIEWSRDQLTNGKYKTRLEVTVEEDESTGKKIERAIPVITLGDDGQPKHVTSDLLVYGIEISGYQVTDWDFEKKTLEQISAKREATMAIITAKANAERARQESITAEEQGKANVMKARYEKEVEKQKSVVDAERKKEIAVIEGAQKVDVAKQSRMEAEQRKLAAVEYKQEQILRGEGDAAYKRKVMEADGALSQKLEAFVRINERYAQAIEKQKWVPEVMMGAGGSGSGSAANDLINLFMTKTAKDLSIDMAMKKK